MVTRTNDRERAAYAAARHPHGGTGSDRILAGRFSEDLRRRLEIDSGHPAEPYADALDDLGRAFVDNIDTAVASAVSSGALRPIRIWMIYAIVVAAAIGVIAVITTDNWRSAGEKARYAQREGDLRARYQAEFEKAVAEAVEKRMGAFEPLRPIVLHLSDIEKHHPGYSLWVISPAARQHFDDSMSEIILKKKDRKK